MTQRSCAGIPPSRTAHPKRSAGTAAILHLAVDPRGRWLVAASGEKLIAWSLQSGEHTVLAGHTDKVRAVAFHPQGSFMLSSDFKGGLLAWQTGGNAIEESPAQWRPPDGNRIEAIAFDPRGRFFVTGGLEGVLLWHISVGDDGRLNIKAETLAGMQDYAVHIAVAPAGDVIAAGSYSGRCLAWLNDDNFRTPVDLGSGLRLPLDPFGARGFGLLTIARKEPRVDYRSLAQLREGLLPLALRGDDSVRPVSFLPNGFIAAGDDAGVLRCWSGDSQHPEEAWVPQPGLDLNRVAVSARASVVLTAGERFARGRELDRRARLVDIETRRIDILEPFDEGVDAVAISGDGALLALGGDRAHEIVVMDRVSGARRALQIEDGATCVALSADARWLAAGIGNTVRVWDLSRDAARPPIAATASIIALAFDSLAEHLAVSLAGGVVCLWDLRGGTPALVGQRTLGGLVGGLVWLDDGSAFVASGSIHWQGVALICRLDQVPDDWAAMDLAPAGQVTMRTAVAVSADGARLVAAGDDGNVARVFDLRDPTAPPRDLRGHDQRIRDVAITPDGRRAATSSEDATVRLWDLDQSEPVVLSVVNGSAGRLAFRGNRLLAVSEAGVHRWNLDLDAVIALAGATASRNLTSDEWQRFLFGKPQATFPDLPTG